MLPEVLQNIHECIPDLAWRSEPAGVVAIRPDLAAASKRAVHRPRAPYGETLEAAGECVIVGGLDEHVLVVCLHGELNHAEMAAGRACQCAAEHLEERWLAEGGEAAPGAEGRVDGMAPLVS